MHIAYANCYCVAIVILLYGHAIAMVLENKSNWIETESKSKLEQIDSEPNQIEFTSKPKSKQNRIQQVLTQPYLKSNETQIQIKSEQKQIDSEWNQVHIKKLDHFVSWIKTKSKQNKVKLTQNASQIKSKTIQLRSKISSLMRNADAKNHCIFGFFQVQIRLLCFH